MSLLNRNMLLFLTIILSLFLATPAIAIENFKTINVHSWEIVDKINEIIYLINDIDSTKKYTIENLDYLYIKLKFWRNEIKNADVIEMFFIQDKILEAKYAYKEYLYGLLLNNIKFNVKKYCTEMNYNCTANGINAIQEEN